MGDNGFHEWMKKPVYCKCSFTDPDGTVVAGERCEVHPHVHQWLRPDNGTIECATCGDTREHYGDEL